VPAILLAFAIAGVRSTPLAAAPPSPAPAPAADTPAPPAGAPATAPAAPATPTLAGVYVDTAIIQRDGDTLRLLNATVVPPNNAPPQHLDISIQFAVDADGKVKLQSLDTRPTTLLGVNALVAGTYEDANQQFELVGPAFDIDQRASWTIKGNRFNGTIVAGPVVGHPHLLDARGIDSLPAAGVYGVVHHDRVFPGFPNSTKTLVNFRQVGDTLVLTAYLLQGDRYTQTAVAVLKRKKVE
jgi:hypothetical protein